MQFRKSLGLPPNMTCLGVKEDISVDLQSSSRLSHQIDFSNWIFLSEFTVIELKFYRPLSELRSEHQIIVPGNKIPKWFNHQSVESSISFWVGQEFPTLALCLALCLDPRMDKHKYSYVCVFNISINGHERTFRREKLFRNLWSDHLWCHGIPHSLLQQEFGDLIQGDWNHVEVSCEISHYTSKTNGISPPFIARLGVHVECICYPQNSIIINDNFENVDDDIESSWHSGHTNIGGFDLGFDTTVSDGFELGSSSVAHPSVNDDSDFNLHLLWKKTRNFLIKICQICQGTIITLKLFTFALVLVDYF